MYMCMYMYARRPTLASRMGPSWAAEAFAHTAAQGRAATARTFVVGLEHGAPVRVATRPPNRRRRAVLARRIAPRAAVGRGGGARARRLCDSSRPSNLASRGSLVTGLAPCRVMRLDAHMRTPLAWPGRVRRFAGSLFGPNHVPQKTANFGNKESAESA